MYAKTCRRLQGHPRVARGERRGAVCHCALRCGAHAAPGQCSCRTGCCVPAGLGALARQWGPPSATPFPLPSPPESVISYHTWPREHKERPKLRAVAALLQRDTSAIVTLKSSGIDRPAKVGRGSDGGLAQRCQGRSRLLPMRAAPRPARMQHGANPAPLRPLAQLEGKRYASYAARFEGRIVQQLIKADGSSGDYAELALPMLGLWNTLLTVGQRAQAGWPGGEAPLAHRQAPPAMCTGSCKTGPQLLKLSSPPLLLPLPAAGRGGRHLGVHGLGGRGGAAQGRGAQRLQVRGKGRVLPAC